MADLTASPVLPVIDDLNRPFWEGCAEGELRLQQCTPCGHLRYPISDACPRCLSSEYTWRVMSGAGEILSWAVFHQVYQPAWAGLVPYNVVLVQLPEGPRMFGNVEPLDRDRLAVGAAVRVAFVSIDGGDPSDPDRRPIFVPRWTLA
jgi:uncharacterized OB-fold protein